MRTKLINEPCPNCDRTWIYYCNDRKKGGYNFKTRKTEPLEQLPPAYLCGACEWLKEEVIK